MTAKKTKKRPRREVLAAIRGQFDWWAHELGLDRTWRINVRLVDGLESSGAATSWSTNYRDAEVVFDYDCFANSGSDEIEAFVIHELLHLVFANLSDTIESRSPRLYQTHYKREEERLVDLLSIHLQRLAN